MRYVVALTKTTTACAEWVIEADNPEAAEAAAQKKLENEDPEENDITFGEWKVSHGEVQESDEQDEEE